MVEIGLSDENLQNLCRLCVQVDDFIVDIFHRLDPNPRKQPLPERIYDLFQVKVAKGDGLPTNICHRCLYYTELFTEFRDNVRKCEARLQNYVASIGILGSVKINLDENSGIKTESCIEEYSGILPDENSLVQIVDPNEDYASSEDSFSMYSEEDDFEVPTAQVSTMATNVPPSLPHTQQPVSTIIEGKSSVKNEPNTLFPGTEFGDDPLKNIFLCQYCDTALVSQIECSEHEASHDAANPFYCSFCPHRSSNRTILIAHIRELHATDRPYVCVKCNKGFLRRSDLKKHAIVHTGIRPYACSVCGKSFSRNTNLSKHLRIHSGAKPHYCQQCSKSFFSDADLKKHQKIHDENKQFKCAKCPLTFNRKDKLFHHGKRHDQNIEKGIDAVECPENQGFYTENMVITLNPYGDQIINNSAAKMQQQQTVEPIKLSIKALKIKAAAAAASLSEAQHESHVTGENSMSADFMPSAYASEAQMLYPPHSTAIRHSTPKIKEKKYHCDLCPKRFVLFANLTTHKATVHTDGIGAQQKKHVCSICSKAYTRKRELQRHAATHNADRTFGCVFCPKKFQRKDKLASHEKIHAEERLMCLQSQCTIQFPNKEQWNAHMQQEHGNASESKPALQTLQNSFPTPSLPLPQSQSYPQPQLLPGQGFRPQLNFYNELNADVDPN